MTDKEVLDMLAKRNRWLVSDPDSYGDVWYGRGSDWLRIRFTDDGTLRFGDTTDGPLKPKGEQTRFDLAMQYLGRPVRGRG
jgi:hypothetical protein